MSARTFIYSQLVQPDIANLVGGIDDPRVFAKKTMTSSNELHPFIVYKLGVNSNVELAETEQISRQYFQIWVHDNNTDQDSDYMRIDEIIKAVKNAFHLANSAADLVWNVKYLETSQDLNDETLNTIFKYARFELIVNDK